MSGALRTITNIVKKEYTLHGKLKEFLVYSVDRFGTTYLEGYLRYKMITPQSVSSEAQVKNFFYFVEKIMFYSQDIQIFVFLTIP